MSRNMIKISCFHWYGNETPSEKSLDFDGFWLLMEISGKMEGMYTDSSRISAIFRRNLTGKSGKCQGARKRNERGRKEQLGHCVKKKIGWRRRE